MTTLEYYTPNEAEQRLINALRSGMFKQTTGALEKVSATEVKNCCLGVACRVSLIKLRVSALPEGWNGLPTFRSFEGQRFYLPPEVVQELGWKTALGDIVEILPQKSPGYKDAEAASLAALNDGLFTYEQIADVIEAGLVIHASEVQKRE